VGARIDTTKARLRLRPTTVRRLRIAAASSLVVLFVLGGAGLLWLAMRASEPRPAESPATQSSPPVRLDTLPDRSSGTGRASGVPSSEMRSERGGARAGEATADQRVGQGGASAAEMRREVAALARENARVQAALSGYQGANPGTGEIVPWIDGPVLYRFGWPGGRRHAGIDIRVRAGTPVHAADSGRVVLSGVIGGVREVRVRPAHAVAQHVLRPQLAAASERGGESAPRRRHRPLGLQRALLRRAHPLRGAGQRQACATRGRISELSAAARASARARPDA
jgi:hypothetical protein